MNKTQKVITRDKLANTGRRELQQDRGRETRNQPPWRLIPEHRTTNAELGRLEKDNKS